MNDAAVLRRHAIEIWQAGVEAVDSRRLVQCAIERTPHQLVICGHPVPLAGLGRIAVVGAGKAGAGMAHGLEEALGDDLVADRLIGWVNVPADCVRRLKRVHLHAARPAAVNEPTAEGVAGTERILEIVAGLQPQDICLVLLSGGGSALLPAPAEGITLSDKRQVTRLLMQGGATIEELNCVRKHLSRVKGGGLGRACRAGQLFSLIISDVIGDRLDVIASGPTAADSSTSADALAILERYARTADDVPINVRQRLQQPAGTQELESPQPLIFNHIIGNNLTACCAAAARAEQIGYTVVSQGSEIQGEARDVGRDLARQCRAVRDYGEPVRPPACLLSGGEPVVHLAASDAPRLGGRNQETALAALAELWDDGWQGMVLLSGGTDGEDGPTDAAGGIADLSVRRAAADRGLDPAGFLAVNNAYPFLEQTGGLLKTGPTHTNVMDLRVALISARADHAEADR